jgi:hypothetical protein
LCNFLKKAVCGDSLPGCYGLSPITRDRLEQLKKKNHAGTASSKYLFQEDKYLHGIIANYAFCFYKLYHTTARLINIFVFSFTDEEMLQGWAGIA